MKEKVHSISRFLARDMDNNIYYFVCQKCGAEGQVMLHMDETDPLNYPDGCGATYTQSIKGHYLSLSKIS